MLNNHSKKGKKTYLSEFLEILSKKRDGKQKIGENQENALTNNLLGFFLEIKTENP